MDEYQHLRESADGEPAFIAHMQGIPPRRYLDEDRAQEARRGARKIREHAYYDTGFFDIGGVHGGNPFAPNPYDR